VNPFDPSQLISLWGTWAVFGISIIIFFECATILGSFLPGDSLLFSLGLVLASWLTATPIWVALPVVFIAAVAGAQVGYWVGRALGPRMFRNAQARIFNPRMLERGRAFFDEHGNKAIVLARFVPVIRALIPALVGMSLFHPRRYLVLNIIGGAAWVVLMMGLGYGLGHIPWVAHNVEWVILAVVVITSAPAPVAALRKWMQVRAAKREAQR